VRGHHDRAAGWLRAQVREGEEDGESGQQRGERATMAQQEA